jgi:hypothetical protein
MTGTREKKRQPNMPLAPAGKNPHVHEREPRTFTDGPLATPIEGDMSFLSLGTPEASLKAAAARWRAQVFVQSLEKLPLLCEALGLPAPPKFDEPNAAGQLLVLAILIAEEFVPGFRTVLDPFPRRNKKGRHGKTFEDEKYALACFWFIRSFTTTDRAAWAKYAETFLDKGLSSASRRADRERVARNLEIRMSPLVSAQRQQRNAGVMQ